MRLPLVAGNWKMNKTVEEARQLVLSMTLQLIQINGVEKVLCPPFPALSAVSTMLAGIEIGLGAQNMHWEQQGAFTGEVSPAMVKEFCQYVILGHSERRTHFGETDYGVNKKVLAAERQDLTPIVCVGETLEQYEANRTDEVVSGQIRLGLAGITPAFASRLVVAYEPVWAIGTGRASTGDNANRVTGVIRAGLAGLFGQEAAQAVRILYGGSVTADNAAEFFRQPEIDGALVGGASLKAGDFIAITQAASKS
jgi:triosephosphate isomerase